MKRDGWAEETLDVLGFTLRNDSIRYLTSHPESPHSERKKTGRTATGKPQRSTGHPPEDPTQSVTLKRAYP